MATQKCLNDLFGGICKGEPQIEDSKDVNFGPSRQTIRKCQLDKKTCGFYTSFSEHVKPAEGLGPARIVVTPKPAVKKKSKREKEEEANFRQGELL